MPEADVLSFILLVMPTGEHVGLTSGKGTSTYPSIATGDTSIVIFCGQLSTGDSGSKYGMTNVHCELLPVSSVAVSVTSISSVMVVPAASSCTMVTS